MAWARRPKQQQSKAIDYSFRLLGYRDRSKREIFNRLKKRQYSQEEIDEAFTKLENLKLVDDDKFAQAFVTSKTKKFWGPLRIKAKLLELGVSGKIIEETMKGVDWNTVIRNARESLGTKLQRNQLKAKLFRLGFPYYLINGDEND
jgi:regulatory protein